MSNKYTTANQCISKRKEKTEADNKGGKKEGHQKVM